MTRMTMHRRAIALALSVVTMAMLACSARESAQTDTAAASGDSAGISTPVPAVLDSNAATAAADSGAVPPAPEPRQPAQPADTTTKRKSITDQPVKSDPEPPVTPPAVRPT
jgi:hypothetical protein